MEFRFGCEVSPDKEETARSAMSAPASAALITEAPAMPAHVSRTHYLKKTLARVRDLPRGQRQGRLVVPVGTSPLGHRRLASPSLVD